jgi:hypothetical protein
MQKNMNTRVHQAKLGKPPRMADIMLAIKAMTHASCGSVRLNSAARGACTTHNADGDGGQRKGVADDAAKAEGRGALAAVAVAVA